MRLARSRTAAAGELSGRYRALAVTLSVAPALLVIAGALLLLSGATAVGVALLALGLLIAATPFGLVLRAFAPPSDSDPARGDGPPSGDGRRDVGETDEDD
jgi:hypothetical protein